MKNCCLTTHTHTHTHIYIFIYKHVSSACGPFIGHYQGLFACVKSVFLKRFLIFFIALQNYVNAKLEKTEMLISNEFKTERYQRKLNIFMKNRILKKRIKAILKHCRYFQN